MSDCGCNSNGNYNSSYSSACRPDIPYPSISHESVPSLIDNLVSALYGAITKSVVGGKIVWTIPCNPSTYNPIFGVAPLQGEGMLCYIVRALSLNQNTTGIVYTGSTQTLTNKTLDYTSNPSSASIIDATITTPTISSPTINNLTVTGTLSLPAGSITSTMIANGTILDADISSSASISYSKLSLGSSIVNSDISSSAAISNSKLEGNPSSTNTISTIVLRDSSGNFSAGTITADLIGNASTASAPLAGSYLNTLLPKAAANISSTNVVSGNIGTTITSSGAIGNFTVNCSSITSNSIIVLTPLASSATAVVTSKTAGSCAVYTGVSSQPFSIVII